MKVSEQWLREWVAPEIDSSQLVAQLSMAGLEVDAVESAAPQFSGIVVGEVVSTERHPDADKLTLCKVNIGADEHLDIVCGAKNVRANLKVAVATVGAKLPGDFNIKKAKLRGQVSLGMLCSESELGLADQSEGIMELPQESPVGCCIRKFLNLDDQLIEIDFTPNRGDCLSIKGLAREVAALNNVSWQHPFNIEHVEESHDEQKNIQITAPEYCPSYHCRLIKGVDNTQQVPLWMKEKLRRCNLRSHSLMVDITNFVMMELGQPMHAFDADKVMGHIKVRLAEEGESLTLLDGNEVKLQSGTLLIADSEKPLAIAGVMGGLESAVTESTKNTILESAFFDPIKIAGVARKYGLATDSAYRFERGVAPELQLPAIERATELLTRFAGGDVGPISAKAQSDYLPKEKQLSISTLKTNKLLGTSLSTAEIQQYLERLGLLVNQTNEQQLSVTAPVFRFDISIEADLIEEVARVFGYNEIPYAAIHADFQVNKTSESHRISDIVRVQMVSMGYSESINYSFVCPDQQALVYQPAITQDLLNPLSRELSQMRCGLWVGLLNALHFNMSRQINSQKLFEIGLCFDKTQQGLMQINKIAGISSGFDGEHDWSKTKRKFDFYDIKGDVENILNKVDGDISYKPATHVALHPGKTAGIYLNAQLIGFVGELHPEVVAKYDFTMTPVLFEIDLGAVSQLQLAKYQPISKFPSISRDLSFVVDEAVAFNDISESIKSIQHEVPLRKLELFDVYQGDNIDKGKKSLAVGLTLQHACRTLVDYEVNDYMSAILLRLEEKFNITLRD